MCDFCLLATDPPQTLTNDRKNIVTTHTHTHTHTHTCIVYTQRLTLFPKSRIDVWLQLKIAVYK